MFSANTSQVSEDRLYVEDVFSTWLYTGNGSTQTITNGIDLAGKGGLVWVKNRGTSTDHLLYDTSRGTNKRLATNTTNGTGFEANQLNSFNSNGFTLGGDGATNAPNQNGGTYASWTFREAPKFFDVVTWTGTSGFRSLSHALGTTPGCIIFKRTDAADNWFVWHRTQTGAPPPFACLNLTTPFESGVSTLIPGVPTDTIFSVGNLLNASGATYVAYLFAHDTTSDGIIQCGSATVGGSGTISATLGWEPQWVLVKAANSTAVSDSGGAWWMQDNMRGFPATDLGARLSANSSAAELAASGYIRPTSTGFSSNAVFAGGSEYIYIAIRRGPMRTPTSGTSVYKPVTQAGGSFVSNGFTTDFMIQGTRPIYGLGANAAVVDRLRGGRALSIGLGAENGISYHKFDYNTGVEDDYSGGSSDIYWSFRRAPSFFDAVCYTGTGTTQTINHNLGVAPELIITKRRNDTSSWLVHHTFGSTNYKEQYLNQNSRQYTDNYGIIFSSAPTATNYTIQNTIQLSGATYVAYLFASCPGVSKIGTYTGNGSSQTINCGFAAGARFVMIKRTDSAGDWFVWDTARGIVSGNDPYMAMNLGNPEDVYGAFDTIDPTSSGFIVNEDGISCNASGATYIYLAVA